MNISFISSGCYRGHSDGGNMKRLFRMYNLVYGLALVTVIVVSNALIASVESRITSYDRSIDNQNFCQLRLYQIQSYQGNPDKITSNKKRRFRRSQDKSIQTIGKAFKNEHVYIYANINLSKHSIFSKYIRSKNVFDKIQVTAVGRCIEGQLFGEELLL